MENQNIIIFLDKIHKNLELGMIPQTIIDIDMLMKELIRVEAKKTGKLILPIPEITEIIHFINNRFV